MSGSFDSSFYYLWLQEILGVGSDKLRDVLEYFGSAEKAYSASYAAFSSSDIFGEGELERKNKTDDKKLLDILSYSGENNIRIITPESYEYPKAFRFIEAPPAVLFARGQKLENDLPHFGVVGTRKPTEFGEKAAFSLSARLSLSGFVIVSGGALGIDKMAHLGALATGGKTVAFLGGGIDCSYLKTNKALRDSIEKSGTLISEFSPKAPAVRYNFPIRNRLISAMSSGVAVIEAGCKSGALITASYAMEQGKEVFAVPGSIGSSEYDGNNQLLRDGAIPLISVDDVLAVYSGRFSDKINLDNRLTKEVTAVLYRELENRKNPKSTKGPNSASKQVKSTDIKVKVTREKAFVKPDAESFSCSSNAKKIIKAFEEETEMSDILSARSGVNGAEFIAAVTELELKGHIKAVPVGRYRIIIK